MVHFAVDLTNVYMTTRLEGAHTYFLPFNQGSNGAGKVGGKGNPVNPKQHLLHRHLGATAFRLSKTVP